MAGRRQAGPVRGKAGVRGRAGSVADVADRHGVRPSVRAAFEAGPDQAVEGSRRVPVVKLRGEEVENVKSFVYLGSTVGGAIEEEIAERIVKAGAAFGQLRAHVWRRSDLSLKVKGRVFQAVVMSVLLYGCEAWAVSVPGLRKLRGFYYNCLRVLAKMPRYGGRHESNAAVRKRVGCMDIEDVLRKKRLRWYGHVRRMPEERWPRRMLGAVLPGKVQVGGRRVTWEGVVQRDLECVGVVDPWKQSQDKAGWRRLIGRTLSRA